MRILLLVTLFPLGLTGQNWPATLTSENRPDESVILHLKNNYDVPLTAYVAAVRSPTGRSIQDHWSDIELSMQPMEGIGPGKVSEFTAKRSALQGEWKLQALVFADGVVAGDAVVVNRILDVRTNAYQEIGKAVEMLSGKRPALADFKKWRQEAMRAHQLPLISSLSLLPAESLVPREVIRLIDSGTPQPQILEMLMEWRNRLEKIRPAVPERPRLLRGVL